VAPRAEPQRAHSPHRAQPHGLQHGRHARTPAAVAGRAR
jgi:hypothetical protein